MSTNEKRTTCYLTSDAMAQAHLDQYVRAMASDTPEATDAIEALRILQGLIDDAISGYVAQARAEGLSWAQIAPALGTTRQGAQQRYTNR